MDAVSNLAVTKANRTAVSELAALGIRSVSISHGSNPIDDAVVKRIPTNVALDARTLSVKALAAAMSDALESPPPEIATPPERSPALRAAQRLVYHLDRAQGGGPGN